MIWALIFITSGLCFYFKLIFKVNFIVTVIDLINIDINYKLYVTMRERDRS